MKSSNSSSTSKSLTWEEPAEYGKEAMKACWRSTLRIIGLTFSAAVAFIFIAWRYKLGPDMTWTMLVAAGGIAIVCILTTLRVSRSSVKVTDKAIVWNCGRNSTVYRFGSLRHCEIRSRQVDGKTMSVLAVEMKNGDSETFGVDPAVSDEVLRSALEKKGVTVVTGGQCAEEP